MLVTGIVTGLQSALTGARQPDRSALAALPETTAPVTNTSRPTNKLAEAIGFKFDRPTTQSTALAIEERALGVETQDDWGSQLRESKYFERLKSNKAPSWRTDGETSRRSGLIKADPDDTPLPSLRPAGPLPRSLSNPNRGDDGDGKSSGGSGTYRTVCVRSCDGFYWPMSFATTKDNFEKDEATCQRSCGGATQARLYVYKNPGEQIEDMEDLDGKAYKRTATAFQFRASYNESCKCRAHPWEEASRELHKSYALEAALQSQADKGDKKAKGELKELRKKLQSDAEPAKPKKAASAAAMPAVVAFAVGAKDEKRRLTKAAPPISVRPAAGQARVVSLAPGKVPTARFMPRVIVMRYDPAATAVVTPAAGKQAGTRKDAELKQSTAGGAVVRR